MSVHVFAIKPQRQAESVKMCSSCKLPAGLAVIQWSELLEQPQMLPCCILSTVRIARLWLRLQPTLSTLQNAAFKVTQRPLKHSVCSLYFPVRLSSPFLSYFLAFFPYISFCFYLTYCFSFTYPFFSPSLFSLMSSCCPYLIKNFFTCLKYNTFCIQDTLWNEFNSSN